MSEIKPALTAEEWAARNVARGVGIARTQIVRLNGAALELGELTWDSGAEFSDPDHIAAIIALANATLPDDDPRKITRADVGLLDRLIGLYDDAGYKMLDMYPIEPLRAKLKSLLPPETSGE